MNTKKKAPKGIIRRLGFAVIIIYACFMLVDMQVTLAERNEELALKEKQYEEQYIINKDVQRQLSKSMEEEEIVRIAREMGYVKPNEKVFVDYSGS